MRAQIIEGSPGEIAQQVSMASGRVIQAILLIEDASDRPVTPANGEDIFAEMERFAVHTGGADYSREAIYTPQGSE